MIKGNFYIERTESELYVYFKGSLIFKKWLKTGTSKTFCHWGGYPF